MDAAARLGRGDALHTVHAALVFETAVDAAPFDGGDDLLDATGAALTARQDLELPALPLGEAAVHPEQVRREERRLVAAGAGADFQDDVLLVVRVLRDEQHTQFGEDRFALFLEPLHFLL